MHRIPVRARADGHPKTRPLSCGTTVRRLPPIDRELLVRPAPQKAVLGHALNLLAGAALTYRQRLELTDPPWALIGFFSRGRLLAPPQNN